MKQSKKEIKNKKLILGFLLIFGISLFASE